MMQAADHGLDNDAASRRCWKLYQAWIDRPEFQSATD